MAGWSKISSQIQRHPSPIQPNHLAMGPCCTWLRRQGLATQKSNAFLVVLTSLSWMLGGSFVSLLLSSTIRAQQLSQSGKISFRFSDKIKSLRVKPSQMNFDTQKKPPIKQTTELLGPQSLRTIMFFLPEILRVPLLGKTLNFMPQILGAAGRTKTDFKQVP